MAAQINMNNYYQYKVEHPTRTEDILTVRRLVRYDIRALEAPAKECFNEHLNYSDAFIAKNNQKLDIVMGKEYRFAKANTVSDLADAEVWYFSYEDNFLSYQNLLENLKKGYSLIAPRVNGKYGVYAEPGDADQLHLHSGFHETWKTLVKAFTLSGIEGGAKWTPPVLSTALFDLVVVDKWVGREPGETPTPFNCVLSELDRLLKNWSKTICSLVEENPYALMEVNVTSNYVEISVYDDIRAIQSSLAEMHRLEMLTDDTTTVIHF